MSEYKIKRLLVDYYNLTLEDKIPEKDVIEVKVCNNKLIVNTHYAQHLKLIKR